MTMSVKFCDFPGCKQCGEGVETRNILVPLHAKTVVATCDLCSTHFETFRSMLITKVILTEQAGKRDV